MGTRSQGPLTRLDEDLNADVADQGDKRGEKGGHGKRCSRPMTCGKAVDEIAWGGGPGLASRRYSPTKDRAWKSSVRKPPPPWKRMSTAEQCEKVHPVSGDQLCPNSFEGIDLDILFAQTKLFESPIDPDLLVLGFFVHVMFHFVSFDSCGWISSRRC